MDSRRFRDELIEAKPDSIVWLMPTPRVTLLGNRLLNCGIPVIKAVGLVDVLTGLLA
jgi:hypothetical protein